MSNLRCREVFQVLRIRDYLIVATAFLFDWSFVVAFHFGGKFFRLPFSALIPNANRPRRFSRLRYFLRLTITIMLPLRFPWFVRKSTVWCFPAPSLWTDSFIFNSCCGGSFRTAHGGRENVQGTKIELFGAVTAVPGPQHSRRALGIVLCPYCFRVAVPFLKTQWLSLELRT